MEKEELDLIDRQVLIPVKNQPGLKSYVKGSHTPLQRMHGGHRYISSGHKKSPQERT